MSTRSPADIQIMLDIVSLLWLQRTYFTRYLPRNYFSWHTAEAYFDDKITLSQKTVVGHLVWLCYLIGAKASRKSPSKWSYLSFRVITGYNFPAKLNFNEPKKYGQVWLDNRNVIRTKVKRYEVTWSSSNSLHWKELYSCLQLDSGIYLTEN